MYSALAIGGILAIVCFCYFFQSRLDRAEEKEMRRVYEQRVKDQDRERDGQIPDETT